jgi:hypothetical protein
MNTIYDGFKEDVLQGYLDLGHRIYCALMTPEFEFNTCHEWWEDVKQHEVKSEGYIAGGNRLEGVKLYRRGEGIIINADNVKWANIDVTVGAIVLYGMGTNRLICAFTGHWRCDRKFKIEWSKNGIIEERKPNLPPPYFTQYLNEDVLREWAKRLGMLYP